MTTARIQPFCEKQKIHIGCFSGSRRNFRKKRKKIDCYIYTKIISVYFESRKMLAFIWTTDELKAKFRINDNYISDKHVESFIKCEWDSEKV